MSDETSSYQWRESCAKELGRLPREEVNKLRCVAWPRTAQGDDELAICIANADIGRVFLVRRRECKDVRLHRSSPQLACISISLDPCRVKNQRSGRRYRARLGAPNQHNPVYRA